MDPPSQHQRPVASEVVVRALTDDKKRADENRRDDREPLVMPAQIYQTKFDHTLSGFVRNISTGGVCLIMPNPFAKKMKLRLVCSGKPQKRKPRALAVGVRSLERPIGCLVGVSIHNYRLDGCSKRTAWWNLNNEQKIV